MCPVPQKAVFLERVSDADGERLLPHVEAGLCIGCGICEYRCPVAGPAAIRVYASRDEGRAL
jgi:ferredoxin